MLTFLKWAWQSRVTFFIAMIPFILQGNVTRQGDLYFERCIKSINTNFLYAYYFNLLVTGGYLNESKNFINKYFLVYALALESALGEPI